MSADGDLQVRCPGPVAHVSQAGEAEKGTCLPLDIYSQGTGQSRA